MAQKWTTQNWFTMQGLKYLPFKRSLMLYLDLLTCVTQFTGKKTGRCVSERCHSTSCDFSNTISRCVRLYIYMSCRNHRIGNFCIINNGFADSAELANDCRFHEMGSDLPHMHKNFPKPTQNPPISQNWQLILRNRQPIT